MGGVAVEVVVEVVRNHDVQQSTVPAYTVQLFHQGYESFPNVLEDVVGTDLVNRVVLNGQLVLLDVAKEIRLNQRVVIDVEEPVNTLVATT
jgi:hypothetical protein